MQAAEAVGHMPCRRFCLGGFTIAQLSNPKEERGRKWRTDDDGVVGLNAILLIMWLLAAN